MAKAENDPTRYSLEQLMQINALNKAGFYSPAKTNFVKDQVAAVERAAHWAPRLDINPRGSYGPLDRISGSVDSERIRTFVKRYNLRMLSSLDISIEEYVKSLPEIPDGHEDAYGYKPFLVEPRISSGNVMALAEVNGPQYIPEERYLDEMFESTRERKPYVAYGKVSLGASAQEGERHADIRELLFAKAQGLLNSVRGEQVSALGTMKEERPATVLVKHFGSSVVDFGNWEAVKSNTFLIRQ